MEDTDPGPALPLLDLGVEGDQVTYAIIGVSLVLVMATVAASTAIRNFRWSRLERLPGAKKKRSTLELLGKEERARLDSLLILMVLASIALLLALSELIRPVGDLAGPGLWPFVGSLFLGLAVFLILPFGIVRGLVRARPEPVLLALLPFVGAVDRVVRPIRWFVDGIATVLTRALGWENRAENGEEALDEILDVVAEGKREGAIDEEEREMIESIIEFRDLAVSEVMTPRTSIRGVPIETGPADLVQLIVEKGHSRIPVYQDTIDNVIGVVHAKDILAQWMEKNGKGETIALGDMMRTPLFIPETKNISVLLRELKQNKVHMAIVLDEYGGTAGLVTMEDLVEEIVGEIEDEYDVDESQIPEYQVVSEREAELSGRLHIDEINALLNLRIPEDDAYDTLGGFIFSALGRVPERGESWEFENLKFEIIDADARRINRVKVVIGE